MKKSNTFLMKLRPANTIRWFYISLALCTLSLLTLITALIVTYKNNSTVTIYESSESFLANETIRMGSAEMLITNVNRSPGQKPFIAPDGYEYILASVQIYNISDKPIQVIPTLDFYAKTDNGDVSYISMYAHRTPLDAGELPVGEKLKGDVAFLIKSGDQPKLYIDSAWSGSTLAFNLQ